MTASPNIIVLGATSLITPWLLKRLRHMGFSGQCHSRRHIHFGRADAFSWKPLDINLPINLRPGSIVISLLPLWRMPPLLPQLQGCRHLIALSTTSIFSKGDSPDAAEQNRAKMTMAAEKKVSQALTEQKIPWTLLRPTLIYDGQYDLNVTAIAKFIQKWRILPIAGPANGLRQPVHADDVAAAVVAAIKNPSGYNRSFNLGGGEILTYRRMVQRIFYALGKPPRILPIPLKAILVIFRIIRPVIPGGANGAMFMRMNQDLVYDFTHARQALDFTPRSFQPGFHIDKKSHLRGQDV